MTNLQITSGSNYQLCYVFQHSSWWHQKHGTNASIRCHHIRLIPIVSGQVGWEKYSLHSRICKRFSFCKCNSACIVLTRGKKSPKWFSMHKWTHRPFSKTLKTKENKKKTLHTNTYTSDVNHKIVLCFAELHLDYNR